MEEKLHSKINCTQLPCKRSLFERFVGEYTIFSMLCLFNTRVNCSLLSPLTIQTHVSL